MAYGDGIERINCYSLTDLHDFDFCPFRFFVKHHLNKKYEIEEGNVPMALGCLLDQSIKKFHQSKAYGQPSSYLINIIKAADLEIRESVAKSNGNPSFYSSVLPFLNEELIQRANTIFKNYYETRGGKINRSLGYERFSEWVIIDVSGKYKLWGGADAFEEGDDGIPEVVDYKSRENLEKSLKDLDMNLMPKIYMLLGTKFLKGRGYNKARFRVRIWQDPLNGDFYEEFDLDNLKGEEMIMKQKINKIISSTTVKFCEKEFCRACMSPRRENYLAELEKILHQDIT